MKPNLQANNPVLRIAVEYAFSPGISTVYSRKWSESPRMMLHGVLRDIVNSNGAPMSIVSDGDYGVIWLIGAGPMREIISMDETSITYFDQYHSLQTVRL